MDCSVSGSTTAVTSSEKTVKADESMEAESECGEKTTTDTLM